MISVVVQCACCVFSALTLLVGWQEGPSACKKVEWWGAGVVICLERGADLYIAQLMPLPLTVSCFSKSRLVLPFWYWLTRVVPEKGPLNARARVCVCVCVQCACYVTDVMLIEYANRALLTVLLTVYQVLMMLAWQLADLQVSLHCFTLCLLQTRRNQLFQMHPSHMIQIFRRMHQFLHGTVLQVNARTQFLYYQSINLLANLQVAKYNIE